MKSLPTVILPLVVLTILMTMACTDAVMQPDSPTPPAPGIDTLRISWETYGATVHCLQYGQTSDIEIQTDRGHVTVTNNSEHSIAIRLDGSSTDGSLTVTGNQKVHLLLDSLSLTNPAGGVITITGKSASTITLLHGNTLCDSGQRDSATARTQKGCITTSKSLTIQGSGRLNISGRYKHCISSGKHITCRDCHIDLRLYANGGKGLKANNNITMQDITLTAHATGNVVIQDSEKTYCTVIKCDKCLTMDGCAVTVRHDGVGGKGIVADSTLTLQRSHIDMLLTGYGAPFLINASNTLDYFTPRCIESKHDMRIVSGQYTLRSTGMGGKGIVCDSTLTIGTPGMQDEQLHIDVTTEGTAVIDDVFQDRRFGCPKAIKCGSQFIINGGIISTRTMGMGGEGVESKGTLTINGGTLVCEAFDDGINVEQGITINGGNVYATSIDNDGIDSNGFITLNGGVVASLTSHEQDEDFDCDDDRFSLRGGTICGIGRDNSGILEVGQPYVQRATQCNIPKGSYITYTVATGSPVVTVLVHDDIPAALATISSAGMSDGCTVNVYHTDAPPEGATPLIAGKVWLGGEPFDTAPLFTGMATTQPYTAP